jgi:hypothetical protein
MTDYENNDKDEIVVDDIIKMRENFQQKED